MVLILCPMATELGWLLVVVKSCQVYQQLNLLWPNVSSYRDCFAVDVLKVLICTQTRLSSVRTRGVPCGCDSSY